MAGSISLASTVYLLFEVMRWNRFAAAAPSRPSTRIRVCATSARRLSVSMTGLAARRSRLTVVASTTVPVLS